MTLVEIKRFQSKIENLLKEINNFKSDNIVLDNVKDRLDKNEELYQKRLDDTCNSLLARGSLKVLKAYTRKCKKRLKDNE